MSVRFRTNDLPRDLKERLIGHCPEDVTRHQTWTEAELCAGS
jgi:hypothetical protein